MQGIHNQIIRRLVSLYGIIFLSIYGKIGLDDGLLKR